MNGKPRLQMTISPLWLQVSIITFLFGFTILGILAYLIYNQHPPIPERVADESGNTVFTGSDIMKGQHVFQRYGLMQYGTIFGHGAYLGPDFTAQYLHEEALYMLSSFRARGSSAPDAKARVGRDLKQNRYRNGILTLTAEQARFFSDRNAYYKQWLSLPQTQTGLRRPAITDDADIRALTAFFAWAAWTTAAQRPGKEYSYTNNWPPDELAGNTPTFQAFIWSICSLIALLGGAGLLFFLFGKYDILGWRRDEERTGPVAMIAPDKVRLAPIQRASVWYFLVVAGLFLAQGLLGGLNAHYHVDIGSFYGFDIASLLPYNLSRTWHVQLAIFFVATSFLAMGIFITPLISPKQPRFQAGLAAILFTALTAVVLFSLAGEALSYRGKMAGRDLWFWLGSQGWEYLDLGRLWQILLTGGMLLWTFILFRGTRNRLKSEHPGNLPYLLLYSSFSIPAFYAVGMIFGKQSNFAVMDFWRFWVVHLWVEDFLELFTTIMVAYIFVLLGIVHEKTATRIVYLDIILYSVGGVVGTMHHLYFSGAPAAHMALGAFFSAMEVIPLLLLTIEGWRFMQLGQPTAIATPERFPHHWTVMFLVAVGFWNFLGAGVFGFLINLPIVSYFEIGTGLTANHAHGAMMGVYGMLAIGFLVFVARYFVPPDKRAEIARRISFWSLNIGLAWMIFVNLFPLGIRQLHESFTSGYWYARREEFFSSPATTIIEWLRLPGDALFIAGGILPVVYLAVRMVLNRNRPVAAGPNELPGFTEPADEKRDR
jgi:nitric oxide reductase subunit B